MVTATLLSLVIALATALVIGGLLGSQIPPERVLGWIMMGLGALFGLCMLVVAIKLSHQVLIDAGTTAPVGPAPAAAASGSASQASSGDSGAAAIANTMTAIGVTVAVVTLILSLGTSWFGQQMTRVAALERKLQAAEQRVEARLGLWEKSALVESTGLAAKAALADSFSKQAEISDWGSFVQEWFLTLEVLRSDEVLVRLNAFGDLLVLDRRKVPGQHLDPRLAPVQRYTESCHQLAIARLEQQVTDGKLTRAAMLDQIDAGLWCRVFDRAEQARYHDFINRPA